MSTTVKKRKNGGGGGDVLRYGMVIALEGLSLDGRRGQLFSKGY